MPTVAQVQAAIRTRLEANFSALELRWQNETEPLPDTPTAFVFVELVLENHGILAYGGGQGSNEWRTEGRIEAHVLVPVGTGVATGLAHAESICDVFRGQRVDSITYLGAEAFPGAGNTEDGSYCNVSTAIISLHFDKTG